MNILLRISENGPVMLFWVFFFNRDQRMRTVWVADEDGRRM